MLVCFRHERVQTTINLHCHAWFISMDLASQTLGLLAPCLAVFVLQV